MDPHSFIARAEAQRWLGIAEKLLMGNDFVGSKTFAIRARESDPRLESADQILAIADTLLAAEKRVVGNNGIQQPDFYNILQLPRFAQDTDHIASQFRRLAVLLNPHQNRFPYSDQAFEVVNDAWSVLSSPIRKSLYDADLNFPHQQHMNPNHNPNTNPNTNTLGFNIEQHNHQQQHSQQHQHNFFSIGGELQPRVSVGHQQHQLQQHNFLSSVPELFQHRENEQLFQPQVQPFQVTSAVPQQTLFSWPQQAQQLFQVHQQEDPSHVRNNNDVREAEPEPEPEPEPEVGVETEAENVDDSPSFWTTCPYCLYMYEYPSEYAECVLRCNTCKRAFQAVRIASPPQIIEGKESYFCCWGFFPLAVSMEHMQKESGKKNQTDSKWTPFSAMYDVSDFVPVRVADPDPVHDTDPVDEEHLNAKAAPKKKVNVYLGPPIYIDDETDDIFEGVSEPSDSDDSDNDWDSRVKKKAKRVKKDGVSGKSRSSLSETGKKGSGVTTRRQSGRAAKEMGRLDLNVEFNNNEGEEPAARRGAGNRGGAQGDGDNMEGIGFFEGLDEFFSSLPILSVVNDEKVKAG